MRENYKVTIERFDTTLLNKKIKKDKPEEDTRTAIRKICLQLQLQL